MGIPVYKIPVIIGITTSKGKAVKKVWIKRKEEVFEFTADEKPLMVRFDEKDNSYAAQAETLRSIGKCGDRSQISFLKDAAEMESPRDVIKRAADWALKEIMKSIPDGSAVFYSNNRWDEKGILELIIRKPSL